LSKLYPKSRIVAVDYVPPRSSGNESVLSPSVDMGPGTVLVKRFGDFVLFTPSGRPPLGTSHPGDRNPDR